MARGLDNPPIVLIGTHRSGTTWLGSVLKSHPALAYWEEPRHVWTWGNARTPDDVLSAEHATPKVVRHIREAFARHTSAAGKHWFSEKTPSNCLRVPFIRAVFPDAKILLVVRDGRSVLRSTAEIMDRGVPTSRILKRALETPPTEWPAYAGRALGLVTRKLTGGGVDYWGPRPPGWRARVGTDREELLAWQWAQTLGRGVDDVRALGEGAFVEFRFEDMVREPRATMTRVVEYLGIPEGGRLVDEAERTANAATVDKWRDQLDDTTLAKVRPHMEPLLTKLGYAW